MTSSIFIQEELLECVAKVNGLNDFGHLFILLSFNKGERESMSWS